MKKYCKFCGEEVVELTTRDKTILYITSPFSMLIGNFKYRHKRGLFTKCKAFAVDETIKD